MKCRRRFGVLNKFKWCKGCKNKKKCQIFNTDEAGTEDKEAKLLRELGDIIMPASDSSSLSDQPKCIERQSSEKTSLTDAIPEESGQLIEADSLSLSEKEILSPLGRLKGTKPPEVSKYQFMI